MYQPSRKLKIQLFIQLFLTFSLLADRIFQVTRLLFLYMYKVKVKIMMIDTTHL